MAELLRFSSASHLLKHIPEATQAIHRRDHTLTAPPLLMQPTQHRAALVRRQQVHEKRVVVEPAKPTNIWEGWGDGLREDNDVDPAESADDLDLDELGL